MKGRARKNGGRGGLAENGRAERGEGGGLPEEGAAARAKERDRRARGTDRGTDRGTGTDRGADRAADRAADRGTDPRGLVGFSEGWGGFSTLNDAPDAVRQRGGDHPRNNGWPRRSTRTVRQVGGAPTASWATGCLSALPSLVLSAPCSPVSGTDEWWSTGGVPLSAAIGPKQPTAGMHSQFREGG